MAILNLEKQFSKFSIAPADKNIDNSANLQISSKKSFGWSLSVPLNNIRIKVAKFMP